MAETKGSIAHQILRHLYNEDVINENRVDITAFLKRLRDVDSDKENNSNRITYALSKIKDEGYAIFYYLCKSELGNEIPIGQMGGACNLDNTVVTAKFLMAGYDYTLNYVRGNEQHKSTMVLNDSTIPDNFVIQKNLTLASIVVAGAAALFVLASVIVSICINARDTTSQSLQQIDTLLQKQSKILDNMQKAQTGIDLSFGKAVKDSLYVNHK